MAKLKKKARDNHFCFSGAKVEILWIDRLPI
jgi:hypothetical protein